MVRNTSMINTGRADGYSLISQRCLYRKNRYSIPNAKRNIASKR